MWEPLNQEHPEMMKDELPPMLDKIGEIDMNHLINKLHDLKAINKQKQKWGIWVYILIIAGAGATIILIITKRKNIVTLYNKTVGNVVGGRQKANNDQTSNDVTDELTGDEIATQSEVTYPRLPQLSIH